MTAKQKNCATHVAMYDPPCGPCQTHLMTTDSRTRVVVLGTAILTHLLPGHGRAGPASTPVTEIVVTAPPIPARGSELGRAVEAGVELRW